MTGENRQTQSAFFCMNRIPVDVLFLFNNQPSLKLIPNRLPHFRCIGFHNPPLFRVLQIRKDGLPELLCPFRLTPQVWKQDTSLMNWPMMLAADGKSVFGGSDNGSVFYWKL